MKIKFLFIPFFIALVLVGCANLTDNQIKDTSQKFLTDEKYCEKDSDCTIQSHCCGSGEAVNKQHYKKIECHTKCAEYIGESLCEQNKCITDREIKNPSLCGRFKNEWIRNNCYKDFELCDNIGSADTKYRCFQELAEKQKNVEICNKINYSQIKNDCYFGFALITADESLCEKIIDNISETMHSSSMCYAYVGKIKHNLDICSRSKDAENIKYCSEAIDFESNSLRDMELFSHLDCEKIADEKQKKNCVDKIDSISK